jgi:hypothetical protein
VDKEKSCGVSDRRRVGRLSTGESTDSADGERYGQPATLTRMASDDGRFGQHDRPRSSGASAASADLWSDDSDQPWSQTPAFLPGTAHQSAVRPVEPAADDWSPGPGWVRTASGAWAQQHATGSEWPSGDIHAGRGPDLWPGGARPPMPPTADLTAAPSRPPAGDAAPAGRHHEGGPGLERFRPRPASARPPQRRPAPGTRADGRHAARMAGPPTPTASDAPYGRVLGVTAAFYTAPAVLVMIWLLVLDGDRRTVAGREVLTNLPWIFMALVVSLGVAAALRWAAIGWRTWTMCFAAAIIGAGVATIVHSFSL